MKEARDACFPKAACPEQPAGKATCTTAPELYSGMTVGFGETVPRVRCPSPPPECTVGATVKRRRCGGVDLRTLLRRRPLGKGGKGISDAYRFFFSPVPPSVVLPCAC